MGCCYGHGHGPWCGWGYGYGLPPYEPGPYAYRPRRRRRGVPDEADLEAYLEDLEEELDRVRRDLEAARTARSGEG